MRQRANIAEGRQKKEEKAERSTETWEIGERFFFLVGSKKEKGGNHHIIIRAALESKGDPVDQKVKQQQQSTRRMKERNTDDDYVPLQTWQHLAALLFCCNTT